MKNLKRSIGIITTAAMISTMLTSVPVMAADADGIDIALTNTNYSAIGESGKITVCKVDAGKRGEEITSGLTFTSSDESIVGNINGNGEFTTNGFGVVKVEVVYDNGTAGDTTDDIKRAVMINCYDGSLQNAVMQQVYVDDENKVQKGLGKEYYNAITLIEKEDPMHSGRTVIGESNNSATVGITKNNAELGENVNSVVFNGWFYDDAEYVSSLGFTYAAKYKEGSTYTDVYNLRDSKYSFALDVDNLTGVSPAPYMLRGGRYSMQNVRQEYVSASESQNYKGAISEIPRGKGWHQMTAITEPSITMPGEDYMLVKVYIDGELVTCQDIYVGAIPAGERAFGFFLHGQNVGQSKYVYYDDIVITKYTTSNAVRDITPSNGAKNVPVSSDIKIKFADKVNADSNSFVLSDGSGNVKIKTELDETGTVVTIRPSKLEANTAYTLSAGSSLAWADGTAIGDGISCSFTTSASTALADALANMNEYKVQSARSIDFADPKKSAMEYGVGFMYGYAGTSSRINADGSATFTEGTRKAVAAAKQNQMVIRNISDVNAEADRVVVSYKFKPDMEQINSTTYFGGGLGVPYMAVKNTEHKFDDRTVGMLSGGKLDVFPSFAGIVNDNKLVRMYLIQGNRNGGDTAYHENAVQNEDGSWVWNPKNASNGNVAFLDSADKSASNAVNLVPDKDGYYRMTYVVDVDTAGQLYPKWTVIFGEDFEDRNNIFALHTEPIDKTAYTSVDSLTIPLLKSSAINENNCLSVKDIEIYNLKKSVGVRIDNTITVKDSQSGTELEPGDVAGKKVDIELNASGNGENYTTIVAAYDNDNMLLNVAVTSGIIAQDQSNIGVSSFDVPQNSDRLRVFVWNSFESCSPIMPKIDYALTK